MNKNYKTLLIGIAALAIFALVTNIGLVQASFTPVVQGGTGNTSSTPYAPLIGGNSSTSALNFVPLGASGTCLTSNGTGAAPTFQTCTGGGGGGGVSSVAGTANQIDVANGTTNAVVSIDGNYTGQSSITTLGTVGTGVWQGNPIGTTYGGTGAAFLGSSLTNSGSTLAINTANPNTFTASQTMSGSPFTITGNQTVGAWTTGGTQLVVAPATLTDTSSTGTVTTNAANAFGIPTFAATNATTYTNAATVYIAGAPTAGTNVTDTQPMALYVAGGQSVLAGGVSTSNTSTLSNFYAPGGNITGGTGSASAQLAGSAAIAFRTVMNGTGPTVPSVNQSYASLDIGANSLTTPTSGTMALITSLGINAPVANSSGSSVTTMATEYIQGAPNAIGGAKSYALDVNAGLTNFGGAIIVPHYTVATLPAGPVQGEEAIVTDALTPTFLGTLTGGSSTVTPVVYNGTAWVAY